MLTFTNFIPNHQSCFTLALFLRFGFRFCFYKRWYPSHFFCSCSKCLDPNRDNTIFGNLHLILNEGQPIIDDLLRSVHRRGSFCFLPWRYVWPMRNSIYWSSFSLELLYSLPLYCVLVLLKAVVSHICSDPHQYRCHFFKYPPRAKHRHQLPLLSAFNFTILFCG